MRPLLMVARRTLASLARAIADGGYRAATAAAAEAQFPLTIVARGRARRKFARQSSEHELKEEMEAYQREREAELQQLARR